MHAYFLASARFILLLFLCPFFSPCLGTLPCFVSPLRPCKNSFRLSSFFFSLTSIRLARTPSSRFCFRALPSVGTVVVIPLIASGA